MQEKIYFLNSYLFIIIMILMTPNFCYENGMCFFKE